MNDLIVVDSDTIADLATHLNMVGAQKIQIAKIMEVRFRTLAKLRQTSPTLAEFSTI